MEPAIQKAKNRAAPSSRSGAAVVEPIQLFLEINSAIIAMIIKKTENPMIPIA
jgi:hypothetical protein